MAESTAKIIELPANIVVRDLATELGVSSIQIIKTLMANGVMANINQLIDFETAAVVASELGFEARIKDLEEEKVVDVGELPDWRQKIMDEDPSKLVNRPPVVTILGHVDHGKTTLLDAIRHTDVAGGEAGGITQHIGAYQVEHKGRTITFLDTPGHAAFTAMRARGAQGADIVILVVAADDGVMPQTKEAIAHAKAAKVPIIVALNKIDRPNANPDYVKHQLADNGLQPDDWEGDTMVVPVSAKQRLGLEDLLEAILLVTDHVEIKANPEGTVAGTVIEAEMDKAKGVVATFLVQNGTLQMGDAVVAGSSSGKLRAMLDHRGKMIHKAGPSTPVRVMGLNEVPSAGDIFSVYPSEKEARSIAEANRAKMKAGPEAAPKTTLEDIFEKFKAGEVKELPLIVKADVQGSLEPIINSVEDLNCEEIKINILHSGTGEITETDVNLAEASKAIIIGFNVTADPAIQKLADSKGVSIRKYAIIYRLTEDIDKALKGMLAPEFNEVITGTAAVQAVFHISKLGNIAGCKVVKGEIRRNGKMRVKRGDNVVFENEVSSLKHEKEDVREVRQGFECGIGVRNFDTFMVGDILECYVMEKVG
jgi:translation initiation factor IF-2